MKRIFVASVLGLAMTVAPVRAADQTILGAELLVRNPEPIFNPAKRKVVATAKEVASPHTIVGNPVAAGASLSITANGGTPSAQIFALPAGMSASTGQPFWSGDAVSGFKYQDPRGENGPVTTVLLKKSGSGQFRVKVVVGGKLGLGLEIAVLPPNPGTDGCVRLEIGGGDTYHVRFGADGQVTNNGAKQFKVSKPTVEGTCPTTTTTTTSTTTTTIPQPCSFLLQWGVPGGTSSGELKSPGGVATDGSGNVYVVDANNRIQKFDASGTFLTTWGSAGSANGQFADPVGVATDASGNVYVADAGNNRIQKFDASGTFLTTWGNAGSGNGQFSHPVGVATDASGNVYVVDAGNHRIQKFDASGTFLTTWGSAGLGNGQFNFLLNNPTPTGVATDGSGNVYVADTLNHRIQKFDASGTFLTTWGSAGLGNGQFGYATGVATDGSGNVYVADAGFGVDGRDRIQKFDASGTFLTTWGSAGSANGQFKDPLGVGTDASGNVYVADATNSRIQKFDANGVFLTTWGSARAVGEFDSPGGVATDASGDVYVADAGNDRIQKFDASGTFLTTWGSAGSGNGQFLSGATGVATDGSGNVYVADAGNNRIQKFDASGAFLTTLGSVVSANGQFNDPVRVATDAGGNVYVTDNGNARIQKFDASGTFLTQWGSPEWANNQMTAVATSASGNVYVAAACWDGISCAFAHIQEFDAVGILLNAWGSFGYGDGQFWPLGMATDASGSVYVADAFSSRIQKFDAGGAFLIAFGSGGSGNGQFSLPTGIATDASGDLYVADTGNDRIQKFACP
jgi:DNA-binding beta-propeller fold protein YncE